MHWDGRQLPATRSLWLCQLDALWWMTFDNGRPFHPWLIGAQVVHPCADDTYRGWIEARNPAELTITWDVDGPTKNQLIVSRLTRLT